MRCILLRLFALFLLSLLLVYAPEIFTAVSAPYLIESTPRIPP